MISITLNHVWFTRKLIQRPALLRVGEVIHISRWTCVLPSTLSMPYVFKGFAAAVLFHRTACCSIEEGNIICASLQTQKFYEKFQSRVRAALIENRKEKSAPFTPSI